MQVIHFALSRFLTRGLLAAAGFLTLAPASRDAIGQTPTPQRPVPPQ